MLIGKIIEGVVGNFMPSMQLSSSNDSQSLCGDRFPEAL